MRKKIDRLFVAEYENTKIWTARTSAILSKIQEGDFYLIFKTGKGMLPTKQMAELVNNMADAKEIYDVQGLSDENYKLFILEKIKEFSNVDTYVYFLSMEALFNQVKNDIKNVADVQSFIDYKVGRKPKKTVMKNPTGKNTRVSYSKENDNSDLFSSVVSITTGVEIPNVDNEKNLKERIDEVSLITEGKIYKKEEKNAEIKKRIEKEDFEKIEGNTAQSQNNKKKIEKKEDKKTESKLVTSELENMTETLIGIENVSDNMPVLVTKNKEETVNKQPKNNKNSVNGNIKSRQKKQSDEIVESGPSINELEKMIFGNKIVDGQFKKEYTDLDNEKAQMITALYDRLIKNINKLIRNISTYDFSQGKYMELITVIIKSDGFEDFIKSWEVIEPGYPLQISENIYLYIYDEAQYYAKVCEVLYGEDEW